MWFMLTAAAWKICEFNMRFPCVSIIFRDGRVTVRLLIKYLANKLGLEEESEVFKYQHKSD